MLDKLSSGLPGLLIGAVVGLLLGVVFEDRLKQAKERQLFQLGPLETDLLVVEGDGTQVIDEQAVRVLIRPHDVELPPAMASWRDELGAEQNRLREAGLHHFWNGPSYALAGFSVSRIGVDEAPEVTLTLAHSDYYTFLTTQQLDRDLPDGSTARQRYLEVDDVTEVPSFMSSSFGTYVAVVTSDNLALFSRRSASVGAFPGRWDASANEALSRSLDSTGRTPPNVYDVARRGLAEELALHPSEYRLELLAFDVARRSNQWGCMFVAFLHDVTAEQLAERLTRGVADHFEHDAFDFQHFNPRSIVSYLLRPDRRNDWTPVAPALYYLGLVRMYGRTRVEKDASHVLTEMATATRRRRTWRSRA